MRRFSDLDERRARAWPPKLARGFLQRDADSVLLGGHCVGYANRAETERAS